MSLSTRSQDCFHKVLSHSLHVAASDLFERCSFNESAANDEDIKAIPMSRIMLTIAGIDFRVTFLLHYANNDRLAGVVKATSGDESGNSQASESELDAYFLELGNRFCGEAKRLCYESFDHLGMSTPCVLSVTTTLADMNAGDMRYAGHVRFDEAGSTLLAGSVYVYSPDIIEFELDESHFAEQEGAGELEFF